MLIAGDCWITSTFFFTLINIAGVCFLVNIYGSNADQHIWKNNARKPSSDEISDYWLLTARTVPEAAARWRAACGKSEMLPTGRFVALVKYSSLKRGKGSRRRGGMLAPCPSHPASSRGSESSHRPSPGPRLRGTAYKGRDSCLFDVQATSFWRQGIWRWRGGSGYVVLHLNVTLVFPY